tara:strand:+ start:4517 stop:5185 length:669 start_codon:yes stop_codon:yes gene_type:complete
MSQEIHNYTIERFTFGDDDYYDIDYWDGSAYQTAKIKGSTIKADIQAGRITVSYTFPFADGTVGQYLATDGAGNLVWTSVAGGDMLKSVYDPTNFNASPFDYANRVGTQQIHDITSFAIATNTNNFGSGITDFELKNLVRVLTTSSGLNITGFVAPSAGVNRVMKIYNANASNTIILTNDDAASSAGNRILINGGSISKQINTHETVTLWYDHVDSYWKILN